MLAIVAGILVARHLKTTEDLFDTRDSPRTRSMVIAALQWAKRIMGKIDEECFRKRVEQRNRSKCPRPAHIGKRLTRAPFQASGFRELCHRGDGNVKRYALPGVHRC